MIAIIGWRGSAPLDLNLSLLLPGRKSDWATMRLAKKLRILPDLSVAPAHCQPLNYSPVPGLPRTASFYVIVEAYPRAAAASGSQRSVFITASLNSHDGWTDSTPNRILLDDDDKHDASNPLELAETLFLRRSCVLRFGMGGGAIDRHAGAGVRSSSHGSAHIRRYIGRSGYPGHA
jgi:hypothetical protein